MVDLGQKGELSFTFFIFLFPRRWESHLSHINISLVIINSVFYREVSFALGIEVESPQRSR